MVEKWVKDFQCTRVNYLMKVKRETGNIFKMSGNIEKVLNAARLLVYSNLTISKNLPFY